MAVLPRIAVTAVLPWSSRAVVVFFTGLRRVGIGWRPAAVSRWLCRRGVWCRVGNGSWWRQELRIADEQKVKA